MPLRDGSSLGQGHCAAVDRDRVLSRNDPGASQSSPTRQAEPVSKGREPGEPAHGTRKNRSAAGGGGRRGAKMPC